MGLDMYLDKRHYIGANWEHRGVQGTVDISINGVPVDIQFNRIHEISERVGYWRKANAIHKWFVDNIQDGVDECQESEVSRSDLESLLRTVNKILDHCKLVDRLDNQPRQIDDPEMAAELLPTQSGFFFGSTDYDEWYYNDLVDTKRILENVLSENGDYFVYHASW